MRARWRPAPAEDRADRPVRAHKWLLIALGAMYVQQTFASLGRVLPPVIAPAILSDLALDPSWLGLYVAFNSLAALLFQLGCGSFIVSQGALRMSQAALAMLAIGLVAAAFAPPLILFAVAAIIGGGGTAVSTPASSHLLGRYSPPRLTPLVFSIKQTAVPTGLLLAGILGPWMVEATGWRGAMIGAGVAAFAFAVMLEPLRGAFDADRKPGHSFRLSDFHTTIATVLRQPDLRTIAMACFAYNGLQTVFTSYFVVYLTSLDHGLATAGFVFSVAMVVAVPGRILWGWLSSYRISPQAMMEGLALGMGICAALAGLYDAQWSLVLVGLVATGLGLTAMSWHGVLLAETARLAPEGKRGSATGGVLSFGQVGGLALPMIYALLLHFTGSHGLGFAVCGVPALLVFVVLMRRRLAR